MAENASASHGRETRQSLNRRILRNTTLNIFVLVVVCCVIMALSMQSLANSILLDSLQPMARQSAKTVEANIHMLADRMMTLANDPRMNLSINAETQEVSSDAAAVRESQNSILLEAAETYELYTIALYDLEGQLIQEIGDSPEELDHDFFALLRETDNLTTCSSTLFQGKPGITMGMPVKRNEETILYLVGIYKYDTLSDVISNINIGKHGTAYITNREGLIVGHPDQSLITSGYTMTQLNGDNEETFSRVTTGETGAIEFPVNGETMLVAFSPVRGTQWSLVIQIPKSDYSHFINTAMLLAVLATLAVLVISILLVLRLSRSISRPVKNVTERIITLSDGDLHTEVASVRSGDELEVLTRTLGDTIESVNCYISDIQQVLTHVADGNLSVEPQVDYKGDFSLIRASLGTILQSMNETISGFRSAATRLADMSEELNAQSGQLHQASMEQNQSTEALVHEVSNVKERLASVTESTGQTRAKSEEIAQRVQEANARMTSLSDAMDNISSNAQEITKIAKAIEDIAFQTSILALNASVEAARAGEAGKGFAVVAEEVQQLAAKTSAAAQSATEMVSNTRTIIHTGVALTADTAEALRDISSVSDQISSISDKLVAAVRDQESALSSMEERIETISSIADQNLQNAEGTEQSSGSLAKEAEILQTHVEKFILKEGRDR